jgi:hypothetical protein
MNLGYLAGFFDGEGCISNTIAKSKPGHRITEVVYFRVMAYNTNREPIDLFQRMLGGRIDVYHQRGKTTTGQDRRAIYRWMIFSKLHLQRFVDILGDKLLVKAPQVAVLREYLSLPDGRRLGSRTIPDEIRDKRQELRRRLRTLNRPNRIQD